MLHGSGDYTFFFNTKCCLEEYFYSAVYPQYFENFISDTVVVVTQDTFISYYFLYLRGISF